MAFDPKCRFWSFDLILHLVLRLLNLIGPFGDLLHCQMTLIHGPLAKRIEGLHRHIPL